MNPKYYGPFEIIAQPGPIRYKLKLPADCQIHDTFHVARLKPYNDPELVRHGSRPLPKEFRTTAADTNSQYEIEKILDYDTIRGTRWYFVHWKGYDEVMDSTWEKRSSLTGSASAILRRYEILHPIVPGEKARKKRRKKT